jgi:hypothetical protein
VSGAPVVEIGQGMVLRRSAYPLERRIAKELIG